MYKECKTEQSVQRQRYIAGSLRKMMETEDYRQITVSALCQYTGIPRKGFYRYFDTKDDVFRLIAEQMMKECSDYCTQGKKSAVDVDKERLVRFFEFWKNNKSFLKSIHSVDAVDMLLRCYLEYSIRLAAAHVSGFDKKRHMQVIFASCGMSAMLYNWHLGDYEWDPQEMAEYTIHFLTEPLVVHIDRD